MLDIGLANTLLWIANFVMLLASLSLMRDFYKKPTIYKIQSALGTFVGMCFVASGYVFLENWLGLLFLIPTVAFWLIATSYSIFASLERRFVRKQVQKRMRRCQ